jgi:hypothetical protein
MPEEEKFVQRNLKLRLWVRRQAEGEEGKKQLTADRSLVRSSMKLYRTTLRSAAATLEVAYMAGAEFEVLDDENGTLKVKIRPSHKLAFDNLVSIFGYSGKTNDNEYYQLRPWVMKQFGDRLNSSVWDNLKNELAARWKAKDPEIKKASRGLLVMGGDRRPPLFRYATLPISSAMMKIEDPHAMSIRFGTKHAPRIQFGVRVMEKRQWGIWQDILAGKIEMGEPIRLREVGGESSDFELNIGYSVKMPRAKDIDPEKVLAVGFDNNITEQFIGMRMVPGHGIDRAVEERFRAYEGAMGALEIVRRLGAQQAVCREARQSCGSWQERREGAGHPKAFRAISGRGRILTEHRLNVVRSWNHVWAFRIVKQAKEWCCGQIEVADWPRVKVPKPEKRWEREAREKAGRPQQYIKRTDFFGFPWQYADLGNKIREKAEAIGISVKIAGEKVKEREEAEEETPAAAPQAV